jgi:replicative DNA helicase
MAQLPSPPELRQSLDTSAAPWSQDAEEATIGSVLVSPRMFPILQDFLQPRHFYLIRCRFIWQAFIALSERGDDIDLVSVSTHLQEMDMQTFKDMGAFAHLIALTQACDNSLNAETYGRMVHRMAIRRDMLQTADELREAALNQGLSTDAAITRLDRKAVDLRRELTRVEAPIRTMEQAGYSKLERYMEAKRRHKENPHYVICVRTGITDLDRLLDGLRAGITTLAGPTGSGKTAMCLQMTRFAARHGFLRAAPSPARVHFFSGEMTEDQLENRMLSGMTGIPVRHIERGSLNEEQEKALIEAIHQLDQNHALTFEGRPV